jgi:hypothetical protein
MLINDLYCHNIAQSASFAGTAPDPAPPPVPGQHTAAAFLSARPAREKSFDLCATISYGSKTLISGTARIDSPFYKK